jgi:hypothetical protein
MMTAVRKSAPDNVVITLKEMAGTEVKAVKMIKRVLTIVLLAFFDRRLGFPGGPTCSLASSEAMGEPAVHSCPGAMRFAR